MNAPEAPFALPGAGLRAAATQARAAAQVQPLIALDDVTVRYGAVHALQGVVLRIAPGDSVALIGGNGSGKSTLLRVVHGLIAPSSGQCQAPPRAAQAMLFQRPWMLRASARHNIAIGLWLRGAPWRAAQARALHALRRVQLADVADRGARGLSGGQQQRLCIARALAVEPEILLMDEPASALDPVSTLKIEELMHELKKDITIVIVTHNMQQAARVSGYTGFFLTGELIEFGESSVIFTRPRDKRTEDYVTGRFG